MKPLFLSGLVCLLLSLTATAQTGLETSQQLFQNGLPLNDTNRFVLGAETRLSNLDQLDGFESNIALRISEPITIAGTDLKLQYGFRINHFNNRTATHYIAYNDAVDPDTGELMPGECTYEVDSATAFDRAHDGSAITLPFSVAIPIEDGSFELAVEPAIAAIDQLPNEENLGINAAFRLRQNRWTWQTSYSMVDSTQHQRQNFQFLHCATAASVPTHSRPVSATSEGTYNQMQASKTLRTSLYYEAKFGRSNVFRPHVEMGLMDGEQLFSAGATALMGPVVASASYSTGHSSGTPNTVDALVGMRKGKARWATNVSYNTEAGTLGGALQVALML